MWVLISIPFGPQVTPGIQYPGYLLVAFRNDQELLINPHVATCSLGDLRHTEKFEPYPKAIIFLFVDTSRRCHLHQGLFLGW